MLPLHYNTPILFDSHMWRHTHVTILSWALLYISSPCYCRSSATLIGATFAGFFFIHPFFLLNWSFESLRPFVALRPLKVASRALDQRIKECWLNFSEDWLYYTLIHKILSLKNYYTLSDDILGLQKSCYSLFCKL